MAGAGDESGGRPGPGAAAWTLGFMSLLGLIVVVVAGQVTALPASVHRHLGYYLLAAAFGAVAGAAELTTRYRDEPLQAVVGNAGVVYVTMNAALSAAAYGLLVRYSTSILPGLGKDHLMASIVSGFGAMAILRSKFFTIRNQSGDDVAIGLDAAIDALLTAADRRVDRDRAIRRLGLAFRKSVAIERPELGRDFLEISLRAFQNVSDEEKTRVVSALNQIQGSAYPEDLKLQAVSYVMLSVVGERNYLDLMAKLTEYIERQPSSARRVPPGGDGSDQAQPGPAEPSGQPV